MTKLIFEGNFIAKLLPRYRKCKKIAKIAKVNIVEPKKLGKQK